MANENAKYIVMESDNGNISMISDKPLDKSAALDLMKKRFTDAAVRYGHVDLGAGYSDMFAEIIRIYDEDNDSWDEDELERITSAYEDDDKYYDADDLCSELREFADISGITLPELKSDPDRLYSEIKIPREIIEKNLAENGNYSYSGPGSDAIRIWCDMAKGNAWIAAYDADEDDPFDKIYTISYRIIPMSKQ